MTPHGIRAFAPGRVNLIGEHTDYNDGLCLPFAVELGVTVTSEVQDGGEVERSDLEDGDRFLEGTLAELRRAGMQLPGVTIRVEGDLPQRVGLSSSAAFCIALGARPVRRGRRGSAPAGEARAAVLARRERVGRPGDRPARSARVAARRGGARGADRLRTLEARTVKLDLRGDVLAMLDSGAPTSLAASGYNERREECRRALEQVRPRDAPRHGRRVGPPRSAGRARATVISENERVDAAVKALASGDDRGSSAR